MFGDGSVLNTAGGGTVSGAGRNASPSSTGMGGGSFVLGGSGTTNKVPLWLDNSGTLGNSVITNVGAVVGVNTATPQGQLHLFGYSAEDVFSGMGPDLVSGPAFNFGYAGFSFGRSAGFLNSRPDALAVAPNPSLRFLTSNIQRMIITNTGNVGIATTSPANSLSFGGNASRTISVDANPTAATAGNSLTIQSGSSASGSTDLKGGDLLLGPGNGTGTGGGGALRLQTSGALASGTTYGTLIDRSIIVGAAKQLTLTSPGFASLMSIQLLGTLTAGGRITYTVRATDGGSQIATEAGTMQYLATANSITCTVQTADKLHLGTVNSGCTPGFFNPGSQPGVSIFDNVVFSSPAPIVVHEIYFTIYNESGSPIRLEP